MPTTDIIINVAQIDNIRLEPMPKKFTDEDIEKQADRLYIFLSSCIPSIVVKKVIIRFITTSMR